MVGADNPLGPKFWCQLEGLITIASLKRILSTSWLYTHLFKCIKLQVRGRQPQGKKFWCQQKPLVTSVICYKFKKNLFEVWLYTIFSWFYTSIKPRGKGWQPLGDEILMSTGTSCHFSHLLQVSKKSLRSLILYHFFHDFIHVYSPRAGADSPQGTKFWCQQNGLITLSIYCKFQRNLFEVQFYTIFFMI